MDKDQITNTFTTFATPTQHYVYITTNYILNSFSILFSLILIITIIILRAKEINSSNRISLRLIMYISLTEILFSISQMFRTDTHNFSIWVSYLSSWGYNFSSLLICSLIMSILINIQFAFIYHFNDIDIIYLKKYYLIISFSLSMFLSALPISFGKFNFVQKQNYFWYDTIIWEWTTYTGWITFSITYCVVSLIYTFYRLIKDKKNKKIAQVTPYDLTLNTSTTSTTSTTPLSKQPTQSILVSKYISRIILYSLIPILAYLPTIISNLVHYYYTYTQFFFLNLLSLIFISSQGIFTFIIFLFDPIIDQLISERQRNNEHKKQVLDNIEKGVYVENIYSIERELPSNNNDQNDDQQQNNKSKRIKNTRSTMYFYAKNAKNRISILTAVLYNRKKSLDVQDVKDVKKDVFNLENEENDLLSLL